MKNIVEGRRHVHAADVQLEPTPRRTAEQGDTSAIRVWATPEQRHGIWQMEEGVLVDVNGPETVCIISGSASVLIEPAGRTYELKPGDVFTFDEGEKATWTVTERVRKFFVSNPGMHPQSGE